MSLWHLVAREIRHRRANFLLGFLSVTVAVACLVASLTSLKAHTIQTERILTETKQEQQAIIDQREQSVKKAGAELEDAMRKITKNLGFNVWILHKDQNLNELHTQGTLSRTMPQSYVKTLADSSIMTIRHILPLLTHRLDDWQGPKKPQTILLIGTQGEVPLSHRDPKKPLKGGKKVPPGSIVLGYEVATQQGLKTGDAVKLLGREFTVSKVHAQRGTIDDSTVFINLKEAQDALGKQNLINAVLALECNCASADRVGEIRADLERILPGTQVIEKDADKALARAEARNKAKKQAEEALQQARSDGEKLLKQEQSSRESLSKQRESFAAILVPLVMVGCAVWIGFLAFGNVRDRSGEIGILRAIGLRSNAILTIFLGKALLLGLLGAIVGYLAGFGLGMAWGDLPVSGEAGEQLFDLRYLLLALLAAPLLAGIASWIPAMLAARQDPAVVLQAE